MATSSQGRGGTVRSDEPAGADRVRDAKAPLLRVGFLLAPRFTLLPFAAIVDALRLAADEGDGSRPIRCSWTVLSSDSRPIRASCGIEVAPSATFGDPRQYDYVIVVGGLLSAQDYPDPATVRFLAEADRAGVALVGVCTGTFALLRAGLLKGRRCCVSWYHHQDFTEEFPDTDPVCDRLFTVDGRYITCAGGAVAIDLAAWLIERHLGRAYAQKSLHIMLVDEPRAAETPQPRPPIAPVVQEARVRRAMLIVEQHISRPLRAPEIAKRLSVSSRQLERQFRREVGMGMQAYSRHLRLQYGIWQLANSKSSITEIAENCGFSDVSHFSRLCRRELGQPPSEFRRRRSSARDRGQPAGAAQTPHFLPGERRPYS